MKYGYKLAWTFFGGMIAGAATASMVGRGKLRPCAAKGLSYIYDWKDKTVAACESMKEDCEDLAAEAKEAQELRKAKKQAEAAAIEEDVVEVDIVEDEKKH
ncbi:MAG: hypothetical protein LUC43_06960 [Burkholderiales bacterium]|nr:hypothetical protein [Burkholderiales bacterium]